MALRQALLVPGTLLLGAGVMPAGLLWAFQRRLVYFPAGPPGPVERVLSGAREVSLRTTDGLALAAWFLPAAGAGGVTVLVAGGNAGNRADRAVLARRLAAAGMSVLLFDYRGYGGNPGSPSDEGLARDVRAARQFLVGAAGFVPDHLVYYGESLGAAVVTELAGQHRPAGLVLRSPFVDLASVGQVHYPFLPVRLLLRDRYPLVDQLAEVTAPVTVVYGSADSVVPPRQSQTVAAAAPRLWQLVEVAGADHNDPALLDGAELVDAVVAIAGHADRAR